MAAPDFSLGISATFVDEVMPAALSHSAKRRLRFETDIAIANSRVETRVGRLAEPTEEWDIGPAVRDLYTLRLLEDFVRGLFGPRDAFLFHNPRYHSTGAVLPGAKTPGAITKDDEIIGTGDGVETDFQLIRNYRNAAQNIWKPLGTALIALDGTPASPTISATGLVSFGAPPGGGVVITAGFLHYIVVRFAEDIFDFDFASFEAASAGIRVIQVRDFG